MALWKQRSKSSLISYTDIYLLKADGEGWEEDSLKMTSRVTSFLDGLAAVKTVSMNGHE